MEPTNGGAPLQSQADFLREVGAARRVAEASAAAHPADWQYLSLSQILGAIELSSGGRMPGPAEVAGYGPVLSAMRPLVRPDDAAMLGLFARVDALLAFVASGPPAAPPTPVTPPTTEVAPAPPAEPIVPFESLGAFVAELHAAREDVEALRLRLAAQSTGDARRAVQALATAGNALRQIAAALKRWASDDAVPDPAIAGSRSGLEALGTLTPPSDAGDADLLADLAKRLPRIGSLYRQWCQRVATGADDADAIESLVFGLRTAMANVGPLAQDFADYAAVTAIGDQLRRARKRVADWIESPGAEPGRDAFTFGTLAARELNLPALPNFAALVGLLDGIVATLDGLTADLDDEAVAALLAAACESSIDVKTIAVLSPGRATAALDDVLNELVRQLRGGQRRPTAPVGDVVDKTLAICRVPGLAETVSHLTGLQEALVAWGRTTVPDAAPPPEAEPAAGSPVRRRAPKVAEPPGLLELAATQTQNDTRKHFRFAVERAAVEFSKTVASDLDRRVGLQLRAMQRWTFTGVTPTPQQQQASAPVFAELAAEERAAMARERRDRPAHRVTEALQAHALFQRSDAAFSRFVYPDLEAWKFDPNPEFAEFDSDESRRAATRIRRAIGTEEEYKSTLAATIADAEWLLATSPGDPARIDLLRGLRRMQQVAEVGRRLTPAERGEADRALAAVTDANLSAVPSVPDFAPDFLERLRRLGNYFQGRRVDSPGVFFELVEQCRAEALPLVGMNSPDSEIYGAVERQLRAVRWWTANGRSPTPAERQATHEVLGRVTGLRFTGDRQEFLRRARELAEAFSAWRWADDRRPATPAEVPAYRVDSDQAFVELVSLSLLDIAPLTSRNARDGTAKQQKFWDEVEHQVRKMQKLADPAHPRTERERGEIRPIIDRLAAGVAGEASPGPAVPEFLLDLSARLSAACDHFDRLMERPDARGHESAAVDVRGLSLATLDRMSIAFARIEGPDRGIYRCGYERVGLRALDQERDDGLRVSVSQFLPTSAALTRLVELDAWVPTQLRWSPDGDRLAYVAITGVTAATGQSVGWCDREGGGERGRINGSAFTWTRQGHTLLVADLVAGAIVKRNVKTGQQAKVADLEHVDELAQPPRFALSPFGYQVAYACRPRKDRAELWVVDHQSADPKPVRAVEVRRSPGVTLLPFWSDWGRLCYMELRPGEPRRTRPSDPPRTRIVEVPLGDEATRPLYQSDEVELPITPSASPSGKYVAFFTAARADPPVPSRLVLLDVDDGSLTVLLAGDAVTGRLSLGDETLTVERDGSVFSLWLRNLSHVRKWRQEDPDWRT